MVGIALREVAVSEVGIRLSEVGVSKVGVGLIQALEQAFQLQDRYVQVLAGERSVRQERRVQLCARPQRAPRLTPQRTSLPLFLFLVGTFVSVCLSVCVCVCDTHTHAHVCASVLSY